MAEGPSPTCSLAEVQARHEKLDAEEKSGEQVCVAGRLMLQREQGTITFGTLRDGSRRSSSPLAGWTEDFSGFCHLPLGRIGYGFTNTDHLIALALLDRGGHCPPSRRP